MRFKEFLLREDYEALNLEEGIKAIKAQCKFFLDDIEDSGQFMYRGMGFPTNKVLSMPQIKERQPRDSAPAFNVFFNRGIELAHQIPMVRGTSLFCTGNKNATKEYGNCYFVFPKDNYQYIWSHTIADSYVQEDRLYMLFTEQLAKITDEQQVHLDTIKAIFKHILNYAGGDIARAVKNMKSNDELIEELFAKQEVKATIEEIDRAFKNVFEQYYDENKDIQDALRQGGEVLIYDSAGAYFIPIAMIQSIINADQSMEGQSPEEYLTNYLWPGA